MSNSTLPFFNLQSYASSEAGNNECDMKEEKRLQQEDQQLILVTKQLLDTVQYTPRTSTLQAIFDYAKKGEKKR
ncbi:hypothetical protein LX64_00205 [Chitinophaga skermanii]|uniref:Uncharacterized protein n=1 Tax=Chitinophaga skermanii TaxID=331697 RepID=A0A327R1R3_9BACT|nr:hypothetical protein [Chitinophaga skermanii]RAJ10600.1 hypothetical protein LX64_00205 [Chitinophaga skermanii]